MSEQEFFSGEVSEATKYEPVPAPSKNRYQVQAVRAEFLPGDPDASEDQAFKRISRFRVGWQITGDGDGNPSPYSGRIVDQTIYDQAGTNPKTGHPNRLGLYDLIRLKHGVDMKSEITGFKLYDSSDLAGLDWKEQAGIVGMRFKEAVVGLKATVRLYHKKEDESGNVREAVAKIVA